MLSVYIGALILGLGSSFHCLGMCGPLVMALPIQANRKHSRFWGMVQYHIGKTLTYAVLGLIVGFVGIGFQAFKWMQILSIISGVLIIIFAWWKFIQLPIGQKIQEKLTKVTGTALRKLFKSNLPLKSLFFGLINGLLPCGLVYIALINGLLAGSPLSSSLAMVFFGVGTIPILSLTRWISSRFNWKSNRLTPMFITLVGVMIIFRGLDLGIPMLSPKISENIAQTELHEGKVGVKLECCTSDEVCE